MRLGGRLTGHFLTRVAMMIGGLGTVFLLWILSLAFLTLQANEGSSVLPAALVKRAAQETTITAGRVVLPPAVVAEAARAGIWLQVLDENGDEITATPKPAKIPTHYEPGRLVLYRQAPGSDGLGQRSISTWFDTVGGRNLTFVAGVPGTPVQGPAILMNGRTDSPSPRTVLLLSLALLAGGAAVTLGVAWLFGRGLSRPLEHMMAWLSALAGGEYSEPAGRDGRPASRGSDGVSLRRPYSTYREVFGSLDTLTAKLRSTARERARIEAARDEWIAGVTHDLRTPLTAIEGYADVLASDYEFDPVEVRRQAGVVAEQAGHMDALLDDLNLSFRLRADSLSLDCEPLDLIELARESAVSLANDPRAAGRDVTFEEPPGSGPVLVSGDMQLLRRALANLLVNAAVHNPPPVTIRVAVRREGASAVVTVSDDGIGMDEATLSRMFDRYFRGTSTRVGAEGTGLGMAIARQIVEAHGGTIDVASEEGQGTVVRLAIPVTAPDPPRESSGLVSG